jgi:pepF/M3 family oligoendopeptidase
MNQGKQTLPRWDVTDLFPAPDSDEFEGAFAEIVADLDDLEALFNEHGIRKQGPFPAGAATVQVFEEVIGKINDVGRRLHTLYAYLTTLRAIDSRDAAAQAAYSRLQGQQVRYKMLQTRFTAWLGSIEDIDALIEASPQAADHAYALHKAVVQAAHLMGADEETLAAEMQLTGAAAWSKLYDNFSSQITVELELEGEQQRLPITAVRNLAYHSDREVRKAAYEAELRAWEENALPIAAALNGIKGEMLTLSQRRDWPTPLDVALFANNIDGETLDAMMTAAREFFPDLRRYLRAKAKALGVPTLAWYDLFAPVLEEEEGSWEFPAARAFVEEQFATYSDELAGLARRAFEGGWIDAEPREGKRGGAFCLWIREDESRILANFQPSYGGMATLAHELGHAYHNLTRAPRTYVQRKTPMTLAETASNFCETIVREAALERVGEEEQIAILEASLQDSLQVIVDITSRFTFEREVFERREERELSSEEFCEIMEAAQRETYGDGLDEEALHPYMWAVKPHYYHTTYYNFPYMFGLLFSLGLYARYREDPEAFEEIYDDLLASTGMADAASLAARFGMDVRRPHFWRSSLELIREDVQRFEALVEEHF